MFRNGAISPVEMAAITKLDKKTAQKAIKRVKEIFVIKYLSWYSCWLLLKTDRDRDGHLDRGEFHRMMNRNRIKQPDRRRGDLTFNSLDNNKVTIHFPLAST